MAKFITVLNSHLGMSFWQAVQWGDDFDSLENNRFYTAGVNLSLPKHAGDRRLEGKTIRERSTNFPAQATMIQLSKMGMNLLAMARNTATESVMAKLIENADSKDAE